MPFYYYMDWSYIIYVLPALVIALIAQMMVSSAYSKYSKVHSRRGITGVEAARMILDRNGLTGVRIEHVAGKLTDHYDPRDRVLRLSDGVYRSDSIAAIGIAAHEVGHAIQDARNYLPMKVRGAIVPVTQLGSNLAWPLFLIGLIASWEPLMFAGIVLFGLVVLFQLVTLPVEFNASGRAMRTIDGMGLLSDEEQRGARKVLRAAAMTYVAALLSAIGNLLRLLALAGGRRRD